MKIKINVKGMSNKKRNIRQIEYEYRDECFEKHDQNTKVISVRDFLAETVRLTIAEYQKAAESIEAQDESEQNRICKKENPETAAFLLMKALTEEEIAEKAEEGKVSFGVHYNLKKVDEKKAVENAWQCFEDGMIAFFADGERFEDMEKRVLLHEGSEVTFIRLTFLAGRMW